MRVLESLFSVPPKSKTIFITGSSRGIGRAMALRFAQEGANLIITGKTTEPHAKLEGTIHSVADEVKAAGGNALALCLDVRDDEAIQAAVKQAVTHFGGIDVLINNASAISLTPTLATKMKRFDLLFEVNVRATFALSQACIPHLQRASNPHILNLAPPLNMKPKWFKNHVAYSYTKYGMSLLHRNYRILLYDQNFLFLIQKQFSPSRFLGATYVAN